MTLAVFYKLLAIFFTVGLGWLAARLRWFGEASAAEARLLSSLTMNVFVASLLFRTAARIDFARLPWPVLMAYFLPALALVLVVGAWHRRARSDDANTAPPPTGAPAIPATRAVAATYGNAVQLGIPMAAALFGEAGLAIHITMVGVHGVMLLTLPTALAELALAHAHARQHGAAPLAQVLLTTVRNTLLHPVVLPIVAGLVWNLTGVGLHPVVDEALQLLGNAVVPVCLVLIGITLRAYGIGGKISDAVRAVLPVCLVKLVVMPAVILAVAHWGFGLAGVPLAVVVMMAALPVGSNALIFAQRYHVLEAESTAAIVISTLAFVVTASGWLAVLAWMGR
ncbi:MAG: AEC family transporter [Betaproteobacteria bacterium]|nr:AEC family transporter [Betaproteobacteria bacterium]